MAFTMSGVEDGYSYNRFDSLQEKKGKDDCPKCKGEKCKCDEKKKSSGSKPDYLDFDKDGDKEEPMTDALGEGFKSLPKEKMARQANKAYGQEQRAVRKGDEAETNKQMQRRIAMTNPSGRKAQLAKEELEQVDEARKEGESPKEYAKRVTAKFKGGKSKTYDPMKDSSFDHDEAEKTRGQSGKVAEGYQRNPEKGEKEAKKYAPVRGEKTPMPPRGDKRREDFEKWYAKNVREDVDLSIFGDNEIEALIGLYEEPEQIDEIVGATLAGIGDAVGGAAKGVGNAVGGVAKGVGSAVKGVGKGVGKAASGVGSAAGGAVDGVKKTASGVTEGAEQDGPKPTNKQMAGAQKNIRQKLSSLMNDEDDGKDVKQKMAFQKARAKAFGMKEEKKESERSDAMPKGDVGHDIHKRAVAQYNKQNPSKAVKEETSRYHPFSEAYASMYSEGSVMDQLKASQGYFAKRNARSDEEKAAEKKSEAESRAKTYAMHKKPDPYKARAGESD